MTATITTTEGGVGGALVGGPPGGADPAPRPVSPRPPGWLRTHGRTVLALAAVLIAYRVSLWTLVEGLTLDTPLAHLAIVPLIALGLMIFGNTRTPGPDIHDRQLDWIVGLPLVLIALFANVVLPGHLSTEFWVYRVDLVSLPFFVAGVVVLIFGTRAAWRMLPGLLFLFLAWPYPFAQMLDRWLVPFTTLTVHVVTAAVRWVTVARAYPGDNANALFTVSPRIGQPFDLSVASECSGANGLLGFMLVGAGLLLVVRGPRRNKVLWLAVGAGLVWALNVVRILAIFWVGQRWGERVAVDGFHPFIGLVVFNLAMVVMAVLLPLFGLSWPERQGPGASVGPRRAAHRPALMAGAIVVAMATFGVATLNADLENYDLVTSSLGSPRLLDFASSQEKPAGWNLQFATHYDWSKRYFGDDSQWSRYVYTDPGGFHLGGDELRTNAAIIADVITADDRSVFSAYGIEACYRFHNFDITERQSVDLGNGVVGGLLSWHDPASDNTTTTLYWHWPIRNGDRTRWERVTLLVVDTESLKFYSPRPQPERLTREFQLRVNDLLVGQQGSGAVTSARLVATRQFLVSFAQDMVGLRASAASDQTAQPPPGRPQPS